MFQVWSLSDGLDKANEKVKEEDPEKFAGKSEIVFRGIQVFVLMIMMWYSKLPFSLLWQNAEEMRHRRRMSGSDNL